ncbi:MAG: xanthine dehydrogenase family protein molybdopterin-binding subunit [Rhodobacteraceae bacterium]|nr:xanthine dehydrogenase family protein molybdopterin-binding subunit [Paracoccaceae bacterium]
MGAPLPRREDPPLLRGEGRYADDLPLPGAAFAVFARSPHAHARIVGIDTEAARQVTGVLAVLTGADLRAAGIGPIPHATGSSQRGADVRLRQRDSSERLRTLHHPLPLDRVRFAGEAYACVIAETMDIAKDAAELIDASFEDLPAVTDALAALEPGAPELWDHVPGNLTLDAEVGDAEATDAAFARAVHRVRFASHINRVTGVHMEPRTAAAEYVDGRHVLHCSGGGGVVQIREQVAESLGVGLEAVHIVAPADVGGNFGTRNATYPEWVVIAHAARLLQRPVRHRVERLEAFTSDFQARDLHVDAELALDGEGNFLALRTVNTSNLGAHTVSYTALNKGVQLMTGVYRVPVAHAVARAAVTNTPSTIPYRSAGRPEAIYAIERLVDLAAVQCGFDRVALRRRNMIPRSAFPYRNPFGVTYDSGDHLATLATALEMADAMGFEARRAEARARGMYRGLGISNYIEGAGGFPRERAVVTVQADHVEVILGTQDTGQGHRTAFPQLVADWLGIDPAQVSMRTGDTDVVLAGGGSHSGRSLRFGSIVMDQATRAVIARARAVFAVLAGVEGEYAEGVVRAPGTNRAMTLFEIAARCDDPALPDDLRGPLGAVGDAVTAGLAFPYGAAVCEVEIDPETGAMTIVRYTSVDDVGRALNPLILHGQTHGGIVQGVGQAWREAVSFDADGQAVTASLMDYALPRAADFPAFATALSEVPATSHPMGFRPGGEGGTTPALGVVVSAIADALGDLGVHHVEMPATPLRIWEAIERARHGSEG